MWRKTGRKIPKIYKVVCKRTVSLVDGHKLTKSSHAYQRTSLEIQLLNSVLEILKCVNCYDFPPLLVSLLSVTIIALLFERTSF